MKRLLLSLFSIGLILSFAPVRAESKMLNWTKEQLCNVQWGQGAQAVAADAKAVGSLVYEQLPSKEAMKNAAVTGGVMAKDGAQKAFAFGKSQLPSKQAVQAAAIIGKDVVVNALGSAKSFVRSNSPLLFGAGLFGTFLSAVAIDSIKSNYYLNIQEKEKQQQDIVKYLFLPSLVVMGVSAYSATR